MEDEKIFDNTGKNKHKTEIKFIRNEDQKNMNLPSILTPNKDKIPQKQNVEIVEIKRDEIEKLVKKRDIESLKKLSKKELNFRDENSAETLLHIAASKGYLEIAKLLFKKGLSLYDFDNIDCLPIHSAAAENQDKIVEWFLKKNSALINFKSSYRYTPLHVAADNNAIKVMISLIKHQANLKDTDNGYRTALDILRENNPEYVHYLSHYDSTSDPDNTQLIGILQKIETNIDQ